MFCLEEYYQKVYSGEVVDNTEVLAYIKSFRQVVLWGGSFLGQAVGRELLNHGVEISAYWDMRAEELQLIHDRKVIKPFSEMDGEKQDVLVILCIGNTAIMPNLLKRLQDNEYSNVLRGDKLFMGLVCKFNKDTGINGEICNGTMTCRSMFCRKLHSIVRQTYDKGGIF